MTLESESTCSGVPPGLRRDRQACQRATLNTWVGKNIQLKLGLLTCLYSCLNQLFVVLSFHFGLRPIRESGWLNSISGFISCCGTSCILNLTHNSAAATLLRLFSPWCAPIHCRQIQLKKKHIQICTYIQTCHMFVCVSDLTSFFHTQILRRKTQLPTETPLHTLYI